jgi:hypothetical protein
MAAPDPDMPQYSARTWTGARTVAARAVPSAFTFPHSPCTSTVEDAGIPSNHKHVGRSRRIMGCIFSFVRSSVWKNNGTNPTFVVAGICSMLLNIIVLVIWIWRVCSRPLGGKG